MPTTLLKNTADLARNNNQEITLCMNVHWLKVDNKEIDDSNVAGEIESKYIPLDVVIRMNPRLGKIQIRDNPHFSRALKMVLEPYLIN